MVKKCRCGLETKDEFSRCEDCLLKEREIARSKRKWRRETGRCIACDEKAKEGFTRCEYHLEVERSKNRQYRARNKCLRCGGKSGGKNLCVDCGKFRNKRKQEQVNAFLERGFCGRCGKAVLLERQSCCDICCLKKASDTCFGSMRHWAELRQLFDEQNEICPYTGRKLILGVNAHLDHRIPKSKGGGDELDNLQWVCDGVNMSKWKHTEEDFFALVKEVFYFRKL